MLYILKKATTKVQNPVATIEVQDFWNNKNKIISEYAPNTVTNFIALGKQWILQWTNSFNKNNTRLFC